MTLQEQIQQEIRNTVPQMIDDSVSSHIHNGYDSQQIQGQFLSQAPQPTIAVATGGGDNQRAINDIITTLKNLGLTN